MMTKLREMTFIFIWILVIAFVGLMVFEWGMDISGLKGRSNIIGKINGNKITIQEFQQGVQNQYLQEKQTAGADLDENRLAQIRDEVWEQFIKRILFAKEINKRGITVTDGEIFTYITQNPQLLPPAISQNENFMTDGKFDMEKYQQALNNPQNDWTPVENYIREVMPFQKLQDLINNSIMITEEEILTDYIEKNQKTRIRYLSVPTSAFNNDSITISENDIKKYYQNNKSDFKIEEKRKLSYVLFSTDPSPADTARVYRLIEDILLDLKNGADFAQLADEYSEDPSVRNNHGDLGYFEHGRMIKAFSDAAFNAKPGDLVGPVSTRFGLHIIKVHDKKIENGEEQVHASHILLKVNPSALTMENAQSDASEFAEEAKDEGFDVSADKKKYEIKKTADFTNNNYIPGFGPTTVAVQWAFNADLDDISEVIRTSQGYVVFKLESISPAGFRSLEDVKSICKSRIRRDRQKDLAKQVAINIQEQLNNNKTFTDIINNDTSSKIKMDSTNNFTMQRNDPKIGNAPEVTAAAFTLDIEQKSDILESDRGYFIIKVIERDSFNEEDYKNQRIRIRDQLLSQKAQQFFNSWYEKLKEKADIDDNRNLFFSS